MSVPQNPKNGDLYWDAPTTTMRVWDADKGHWKESTPEEVNKAIRKQANGN